MTRAALEGRPLIPGIAEGEALISVKAFTFAHGVDPASGIVTDVRSDVRSKSVKGKVLFYPFGKGSTTASAWFLETVRKGNHPAAIVTEGVDLSAVIGSVMARLIYGKQIPVVAGVPRDLYVRINPGSKVSIGAYGKVEAEG